MSMQTRLIPNNPLYRVLIAGYSFSTFSEGIIMPIYAIFVQRIGGDILEASGAIAVFLIVCGTTTIFVHRQRWSIRHRIRLMVGGWLVWVIGIAFYFFISNAMTLFFTQVLVAIGNAVADPAFDAELSDHTDKNIESYEWGLFEASKDIIQGIAAIVGGVIASVFGFPTLIFAMVAAAIISFLLILHYVHVRPRKIS